MAIEFWISHKANDQIQEIQSRRISKSSGFTRCIISLEAKIGTRQRMVSCQPKYTVNNISERAAVRPISARNTIKVIENVQFVPLLDVQPSDSLIKSVIKNQL